ncbi:glycosyltransferase [Anaerobacillus alkaliphilus]|uniref:Glycosyltransferase n=1 Tax=Anaerobacillus alkaliphilus TaxID=1548597 RepID=A0A4Q0VPR9_9BACI|nr:glycosyltransferase [Anaerobacillus alkaliphilus]RXI97887.1 glycosyltransferase [Anaerobacillus alkaliphilus]
MDSNRINRNNFSLTFVTPYYDQGRGNATTARRIVSGLIENGVTTSILPYEEQRYTDDIIERIEASTLLHVLHFRRFAEWLEANNYHVKTPYIITSGGTDVNMDIFNEQLRDKIGHVLRDAAAVTVFSQDAKDKLIDIYPVIAGKVDIVKQSVWFPESLPTNIEENRSVGTNILLPAGLREVKDVLFVLPALIKLKQHYPNLTFTILGAPLESEIVEAVEFAQKRYPWIRYVEEVPLEEMPEIYMKHDIVINSSLSEGQSSALLEAMLLEKPVVARNNGGNQSIIKHEKTGFLFDTIEDFYQQVQHLLNSKQLYKQISENGRKYVTEHHSLAEEIEKYLDLYKVAIEKTCQ